jgi:carboxymethylenebutenolidase
VPRDQRGIAMIQRREAIAMGKLVTLTASDGFTLAAYRAEPKGKPLGGLVVNQEIFGVNHHIRGVADRYAEAGYLAIAPALFDRVQKGIEYGYTQEDIGKGVGLMQKANLDDVMKDISAALAMAKEAGKVAAVGYCWGGTVTWAAAARVPGLACAIPYYGGGVGGLVGEKPRCPVMFHFGNQDQSIPMDVVEKVRKAHPTQTLHVYHAQHGFNCDERGSYDAASAKVALDRSLEFLKQHLS